MNKKEFDNFFSSYAKNVDNAEKLSFWKLSDEIIKAIIKKELSHLLKDESVIFDAGGGTARWEVKLSKELRGNFIVYDLSGDMIEQARKNIGRANIEDRVKIIQGDLMDINKVQDSSVDHIISIYNPISFVDDAGKTMSELFRIIKPKGKIIIMGQSFYNALYAKINGLASLDEIKQLEETRTIKWSPDVPFLRVFSKKDMKFLLEEAGFNIVSMYGVPVFVQPDPEDFDKNNKKISGISELLEDKSFFEIIFGLEMKYNREEDIVDRGMNIFAIGQKK